MLNQTYRSVIGYYVVGIITNLLNWFLNTNTKLNIQQSTFVSIYIIGSILLYISDILFAKSKFIMKNYKGISNYYGIIPYSDIGSRLKWLISSLHQKYIFRFIVTIIIDTIIGLQLLTYIINQLDKYDIITKWKYRNLVVAALVASFTFFLYLGTLRFEWAYEHRENNLMNILVAVWLSIAIISVTNISNSDSNKNGYWRTYPIKYILKV
jgi:hypothetical protein